MRPVDASAYSLVTVTVKANGYSPPLHTTYKLPAASSPPACRPHETAPDLRLFPFKLERQAFHPRAGRINNAAHLYSIFTFNLETVCNGLPLDHF